MKTKRIWGIIAITLICACSQQDLPIYEEYNTASTKETFIDTESLDNIFYHPASDSYIKKQEDPYHIDNIKLAYKNLIERKECLNITEITPTHYALKIYPRNKEELWEIENTEGINVSYIPFNYTYCPTELEETYYNKCNNAFNEISPYTHTYIAEPNHIDTTYIVIDTLPILYVSWPLEKEIPNHYDYKVEYGIFNPYYQSKRTKSNILTTNEIKMIEREAINIALKQNKTTESINSRANNILTGQFKFIDKTLNQGVPLHNVKIRFQLGSVSWETYSSSTGTITIRDSIPKEATYSMIFFHPKWKITIKGCNTPVSFTYGTIGEKWGNNTHYAPTYTYPSRPLFEAHIAVNHFYNTNHYIPKHTLSTGLEIKVMKEPDTTKNATFLPGECLITIYNNNRDKTAKVISSTLHEIGHFAMHQEHGYNTYKTFKKFIKESWASYVGWYLVREYYKKFNYYETDTIDSNLGSNRQRWKQLDTIVYSPILIDLIDNYNQRTYKTTYNHDTISNIPHDYIVTIGMNNTTWQTLKSALQTYIAGYYNSQTATSYLTPYDYWHQYKEPTMKKP